MKSLVASFIKDMKLAMRSFYLWAVLVFALIFIGMMLFVVPEEPALGVQAYIFVEDAPGLEELSRELLNRNGSGYVMAASRAEVIAGMEKNRSAKGLHVDIRDNVLHIEYILQGYEGDSAKNLFAAEIRGMMAREAGISIESEVTYLKGRNSDRISLKDSMLPIFLVMESALMGMFLVAAYVFMDKGDGTIKAYAVSPGKRWQYLLSKAMVFAVFGWLSGFAAVFALRGFDFNLPRLFLLMTVCNFFGTVLGLILVAVFDSLQNAMIWIIIVAAVFGVSTVSYMMPSFSPLFVRLLPTYPMQFAFREALFPTGNPAYVWRNIAGFAAGGAAAFMAALSLFKKRLSTF